MEKTIKTDSSSISKMKAYVKEHQEQFAILKAEELKPGKKYLAICTEAARKSVRELGIISPIIDEIKETPYVFTRPTIEESMRKFGVAVVDELRRRYPNCKYSKKRAKVCLDNKETFYVSFTEAHKQTFQSEESVVEQIAE